MAKLLTNKRTRKQLKDAIEAAIRKEFPKDTIDVSDGYKDNLHVVVVSRQFDDMPTQKRIDWLYNLLDASDLSAREKSLISLLHPLSPLELK